MEDREFGPRTPPPRLMTPRRDGEAKISPPSACNRQEAKSERRQFVFPDREDDHEAIPDPGRVRLMSGGIRLKERAEPVQRCDGIVANIDKRPSLGVLSVVGWGACLIAMLWSVTVASPLLANALTLQGWRFWCLLALALLPAAIIVVLAVYAIMLFRRMPQVEQFSEADFEGREDELQDLLATRYLAQLPSPQKYAEENGFVRNGGDVADAPIVDSIRRLTGEMPSHCSGNDGWIRLFKEFQALQDERAKAIIKRAWELVAVKTAASPWKVVDMIAVIYNSTIMVARLARLYNRRTSGRAAFRLVCRWFINIYIAGEMGDVTQGAVEWASANELISATYKPLAGFIGKIAEGGANAFLVYRLGCRAMVYFRPLAYYGKGKDR